MALSFTLCHKGTKKWKLCIEYLAKSSTDTMRLDVLLGLAGRMNLISISFLRLMLKEWNLTKVI